MADDKVIKATDMGVYSRSGGPPPPSAEPVSTEPVATPPVQAPAEGAPQAPATVTPGLLPATPGLPTETPAIDPLSPVADPNSPYKKQFELLVQSNKEQRAREQKLKDIENDISKREEILRKIDQDPIAYINEKYGQEAYQRHTDLVLGKPGERNPQDKITKLIESQASEIKALREMMERGPQQQQQAPSQNDFAQIASEYVREASTVLAGPDYQDVSRWYGPDELQREIISRADRVLEQYQDLYGRELQPDETRKILQTNLTAAQVVETIAKDLRSRLGKINGAESSTTTGQAPAAPQQNPSAPANPSGATLNQQLGKDAPAVEISQAELLKLPMREQIKITLAKHAARHSGG